LKFSPQIGFRTGSFTKQHEAVVEVPKDLVQRKQSELINENPREKAIALDFARRAALAIFSKGLNGLYGHITKMGFGVRIAIPS
jgi:hypothetical protein